MFRGRGGRRGGGEGAFGFGGGVIDVLLPLGGVFFPELGLKERSEEQ